MAASTKTPDGRTKRQGAGGGPKTEEGRQRVSMNAVRHGLTAGAIVLANEDPGEFDHLRRMYLETFQPVGYLELELLDEMVVAKWRQRRCWTTETAAINDEMERLLTEERPRNFRTSEPTLASRAIRSLSADGNQLQNFSRYEMRFHRIYHRALGRLLELQKLRRDGHPVVNTNLSDPLPEPASNVQNELPAPPSAVPPSVGAEPSASASSAEPPPANPPAASTASPRVPLLTGAPVPLPPATDASPLSAPFPAAASPGARRGRR